MPNLLKQFISIIIKSARLSAIDEGKLTFFEVTKIRSNNMPHWQYALS